MNVYEWAECHCLIPTSESATPGKFKAGVHEVSRGPLLLPCDDGVRIITISAPTSMGKTRLL